MIVHRDWLRSLTSFKDFYIIIIKIVETQYRGNYKMPEITAIISEATVFNYYISHP